MRTVADDATIAQRFMLVNKWAALRSVALKTGFVFAQEGDTATHQGLLHAGSATFNRSPFVRIVAIDTTHFAFQHRMMMWQFKTCAHFEVALEAGLRVAPRIDNRPTAAARFDMQTAGAMARFAAHVRGLLYSYATLCLAAFSAALVCVYRFPCCSLQSRMRGCSEVTHDLMMTRVACIRPNEFGAWNARWRKDRSV